MFRKCLILPLIILLLPLASEAKPGRSYSAGRTSFSPSRSSASASSRSVSPSKSFASSSGRTYSSGSSASKTSSAGSNRTYSSGSTGGKSTVSPGSSSKSSKFSFDTAAARAQKEAASQRDFSAWKQSQSASRSSASSRDGGPPPTPKSRSWEGRRSYSGSARQSPPFILDTPTYRTRSSRMERQYAPYSSRPTVTYNDPFGSFFWWWLLDRSLNERALWAYHHRSDMDRDRYQALLASDTNLAARVQQLEAERTPVNTNYVPAGLDRDLMYSDDRVHRAHTTRPTAPGRVLFWLIFVPTVAGTAGFLVWLVFFKRWQTAPKKLRA